MGGSRVVSQGLTLSVLRLLEARAVCSWSSSSSSFGGGSFHICSTTQEIHTKYYYLCTSERSCSRAYGQRPVSGRPHRSCLVTKQPLHLGLCGSGIWTGYSVTVCLCPWHLEPGLGWLEGWHCWPEHLQWQVGSLLLVQPEKPIWYITNYNLIKLSCVWGSLCWGLISSAIFFLCTW